MRLPLALCLAAVACGGASPATGAGEPRGGGDAGAGGGEGGGSAGQDGTDAGADAPGPVYPPPFTIEALPPTRFGGGGVSRAFGDADWQAGPFGRVVLVADLATTCYPFESWSANPPPAGQSWPADCDAFDRNFSVYVDDGGDGPPFEVVHAITPFGGPEHVEVDITDLANALPGRHRVRADLQSFPDPQGQSTGSNAGWTVSARVEVTPGAAPRRVLAAVALYAGQLTSGDPIPPVTFDVPPSTAAGRLEYRTSGHGQGPQDARCGGPAEEFCDRRHQIFVDGATAEDIEPWRTDCATLCTLTHYGRPTAGFDYCQENPCGAVDSVRASRANWCPGSMTPPFAWEDIPALAVPGAHTLSFQVSGFGMGGFWLASATYYAYGG
jgi:hypothetical protein